jgi:hypothetical protein
MDKVIEKATGESPSEEGSEEDGERTTKDSVKKIVASQILLNAAKIYLDGNEDDAREKADDITEDDLEAELDMLGDELEEEEGEELPSYLQDTLPANPTGTPTANLESHEAAVAGL